MNIIFTVEAEGDVVDISEYLASRNLSVAKKVISKIRYTCDLLSKMPAMGVIASVSMENATIEDDTIEILKEHKFFDKMRKFPIVDFEKFSIFYQVVNNDLEIIRILHSRRDISGIFFKE